ncbi:helix-turn-helix transcriptional regulator [Sporofaciens sp. JLR.KK001]|uniref:helix-turn-helix domain-containing protein n=1 Tax=Sporofaciens sp. JLR.KK001 TaxID=3112621 RepID=UPI002FF0FB31
MIGIKLKEIRESTGMNKKEFAQYLGLKYTTYNGYETEAREPSSDFLILISEKFDVSIDYLLGLKCESEILHSYKLRSGEYGHIKKYRDLDDFGRETVDIALERETERVTSLKNRDKRIEELETSQATIIDIQPHLEVNAAHLRTDIEVTEEMIKHDDDIMDDDDF